MHTNSIGCPKIFSPCLLQYCTGYRIWHASRAWKRKTSEKRAKNVHFHTTKNIQIQSTLWGYFWTNSYKMTSDLFTVVWHVQPRSIGPSLSNVTSASRKSPKQPIRRNQKHRSVFLNISSQAENCEASNVAQVCLTSTQTLGRTFWRFVKFREDFAKSC